MKGKLSLFFIFSLLLLIVACDRVKEDPQADEMARLQAWLQVHNIAATPTSNGLYYIDLQDGTGAALVDSNFYLVSYTISNLDNDVLETTSKIVAKQNDIFNPVTHYIPKFSAYLKSGGSISGVTEGIGMMKEGGKARFILPSKLAYGGQGGNFESGIQTPAYTTLIYDVELNKIIPDPKVYEQSLIDEYLAHNPGFTLVSDSVYIKRVTPGTRVWTIGKDTVTYVNYTGRFLDGFIFDTNIKSVAVDSSIYASTKTYTPLEVAIGAGTVKPGFEFAIKHMIEGEKIIALIPSTYMYEATGTGDNKTTTRIPPSTPLIFEIELKTVNPKTAK